MIEKWKRAVIHLEGAADSVEISEKIEKQRMLDEKLKNGEISQEDLNTQLHILSLGGTRDIRCRGTAIFLKNDSRYYLLTARHVLYDEKLNNIFGIIFRVPSYDEVVLQKEDSSSDKNFLMNLGTGAPSTLPYIFSDPALDLAIISLRGPFYSQFAENLIKNGYIPISIDDIAEEPSQEGVEVFTIGFPGAMSGIGLRNLHPASAAWASNIYSLPVTTFGRVAMLHKELSNYWVDMSIYPGNSGGPIIENNKLVGIVSQQASIPIDGMSTANVRIPFGKIIKAKYLLELIKIQEQKDNIIFSMFESSNLEFKL